MIGTHCFNISAESQLATKKDLFLVKEELRKEVAETKDEATAIAVRPIFS